MAIPAGFALAGTPMLALGLDLDPAIRIGVSPEGLATAVEVTVRALAAMSCMTLLILTTPAADLLLLTRRLGVPRPIRELMLLIYRLVFVFLERSSAGRQAQAARLGYGSVRASVRSLGLLAAGLFQHAFDRGRRLEIGLAARGFEGDLTVLAADRTVSPRRLAATVLLLLAVAAAAWALTGMAAPWAR